MRMLSTDGTQALFGSTEIAPRCRTPLTCCFHCSPDILPPPQITCRMPSGALVPDTKGTTPLDSWLASHLEGMSARADQRTSEAQMLNTPLE